MEKQDVPFKITINAKTAILILKDDHILVQFENYTKTITIQYEKIRCIQKINNNILINVTKDNSLVEYIISKTSASLYTVLFEKLHTKNI